VKRVLQICMLCIAAVCAGQALAQAYPNKPIRMLVGFSAGSTTDVLARTIGQKMYEAWGQQLVVDNRPSAGGIVASNTVATAARDGYTLLMVSAGHAATAVMFTKLPYDTLKDFAGVSRVANVPSILVVSPSLGAKSVKELIALAKTRAGQFNFSSPGVGSANHLAGEMFRTMAGINAVHVPYKGIPEALTAVVSASVQFNFSPVVNVLNLVRDGRLLALAASTGKRSAALPDVPTVSEAGLSGYVFDPWFGILAPSRTPRAILDKLSKEIARILQLSDVKVRLSNLGADPAPTTPEEFDAQVRAEVAKFGKIVRDAGIKPE
jgi:tripartite-type tricarboxylate transporter receptor subunit TctC